MTKHQSEARRLLLEGLVIPAHPLALTRSRVLDERRQRALTRYYLDAGAGGIAVGVHSTQFEIHDPAVGLYQPVLELGVSEICRFERSKRTSVVKIAGLVGPRRQLLKEARLARDLGYDCGLLSPSGLAGQSEARLLECARAVSEILPLFGFYLQPAVGGRLLGPSFWRRFVAIENLLAIKIAPFSRYQTLDVVRAVVDSGRQGDIALYTGNDDNILLDLLTPFALGQEKRGRSVRICGGLLGHWAIWTSKAVHIFSEVRALAASASPVPPRLLTLAAQVTDANAAVFDAQNNFRGCIAGILEVLARQGLVSGPWCLNPQQRLSPGQADEIDRVERAYPHLRDDDFVKRNRGRWLKN